jgi:hypothetical protein
MNKTHFNLPSLERKPLFEIVNHTKTSLEEAESANLTYYEKPYHELSSSLKNIMPICSQDPKPIYLKYNPCFPKFVNSGVYLDFDTRKAGSHYVDISSSNASDVSFWLNERKRDVNNAFTIRYGNIFYRFSNCEGQVELKYAAEIKNIFPYGSIPQTYENVPVLLHRPKSGLALCANQATHMVPVNHTYITYDLCVLLPFASWCHQINVNIHRNTKRSSLSDIFSFIKIREESSYGRMELPEATIKTNQEEDSEIEKNGILLTHKQWYMPASK